MVQTPLRLAAAHAAEWRVDAEDELRDAVRACVSSGDPAQASDAWATVGDYLFDRARRGEASLAYAEAWVRAGTDADLLERALRGLVYTLTSPDDAVAQLASLAVLDRHGRRGELPDPAEHLRGVRMWPWQRLRVARALGSDAGARAEVERSLRPWRGRLPAFATDFVSGRLRFDAPDQVFECLREPARAKSYLMRGAEGAVERANSLLRRRIALLTLPVILVCVAVTALSAWPHTTAGWALVVVVGAGYLAAGAYAVLLLARLARGARLELEQLTFVDGLTSPTHDQACAILAGFAERRRPFGLLLRSFGTEASERLVPRIEDARTDRARWAEAMVAAGAPMQSAHAYTGDAPHSLTQLHGSSALERWLAEPTDPAVPFVTVTNPAALRAQAVLPRLDVAYDEWETAVLLLISAARVIIVEAGEATPGVLTELQFLASRGREPDTVVVIGTPREDHSWVFGARGGDEPLPSPGQLAADDPALASFAHILTEDEVLTIGSPDALVAAVLDVNGSQREAGLGVGLQAAVRMLDDGDLDGARDGLLHLVTLAQRQQEHAVEAEASFRLGLAYNRLGDDEGAVRWLRTASDLAAQHGPAEVEGLAAANLGSLLMRSAAPQDRDEALLRLTRAVSLQRTLDSTYDLAWSLRKLARLVEGEEHLRLARERVHVVDLLPDIHDRFDARTDLVLALDDAARAADDPTSLLATATEALDEMGRLVDDGADQEQLLVLPVLEVRIHEAAGRTERALDAARLALVRADEAGHEAVRAEMQAAVARLSRTV
ncbi:hypothetical protein HP550_11040 [Cellulomonas humilata]|uniref:Tetratricopeptide repeat protein n=1 Tax=Cellulomonas humilata TaxID=144055 RepID=A0A7Y6DXM2_9CELL|nr:hypothetical protein [Cellulomonas humilata]NUU17783.1 hypothetical protein [Cellulomonas humilata]